MSENIKYQLRQRFSCELLRIRKQKGLSQTDVALQTDLSLATLQKIETGGNIAWAKYQKLMRFYNVDWQIVLQFK